jgi:hypothetical protein
VNPSYGPVPPELLLTSPVRLGRLPRPRLDPELAVVLASDVAAGTGHEAAYLAIGGAFLALGVLEDGDSAAGVLVGDRLLDLPLEGALSLYLDAELLREVPVEALGSPGERVARLAAEAGGLEAGATVLLSSGAEPAEAHAGTLELLGPEGSALVGRLED